MHIPGQGAKVPMAQVIHEMTYAGASHTCRIHGVSEEDETPCMHRSHFYKWVNGFFQMYEEEEFGRVMRSLEFEAPPPEPS